MIPQLTGRISRRESLLVSRWWIQIQTQSVLVISITRQWVGKDALLWVIDRDKCVRGEQRLCFSSRIHSSKTAWCSIVGSTQLHLPSCSCMESFSPLNSCYSESTSVWLFFLSLMLSKLWEWLVESSVWVISSLSLTLFRDFELIEQFFLSFSISLKFFRLLD